MDNLSKRSLFNSMLVQWRLHYTAACCTPTHFTVTQHTKISGKISHLCVLRTNKAILCVCAASLLIIIASWLASLLQEARMDSSIYLSCVEHLDPLDPSFRTGSPSPLVAVRPAAATVHYQQTRLSSSSDSQSVSRSVSQSVSKQPPRFTCPFC